MRFEVCLEKETEGAFREFLDHHDRNVHGLSNVATGQSMILVDNILRDHQNEAEFKMKLASTTVHEILHVLEDCLWSNITVHALVWTLFEHLDLETMRRIEEPFYPRFKESILEAKEHVSIIDLDMGTTIGEIDRSDSRE